MWCHIWSLAEFAWRCVKLLWLLYEYWHFHSMNEITKTCSLILLKFSLAVRLFSQLISILTAFWLVTRSFFNSVKSCIKVLISKQFSHNNIEMQAFWMVTRLFFTTAKSLYQGSDWPSIFPTTTYISLHWIFSSSLFAKSIDDIKSSTNNIRKISLTKIWF